MTLAEAEALAWCSGGYDRLLDLDPQSNLIASARLQEPRGNWVPLW